VNNTRTVYTSNPVRVSNPRDVDLVGMRVSLDADFDQIRSKKGSESGLNDADAEQILMAANAPEIVASAYLQHAADRRAALVFTPGVKSAYETAEVLKAKGVAAEGIVEDTSITERRQILARLRDGVTRVVVNCLVLVEGVDAPHVDCIVVVRPTKSKGLYTQIVGRGTRPSPATGKHDCLVLDLAGASRRHNLMSLGALTGMKIRKGESLMKAEQRVARERVHAEQKRIEAARLQAEQVNLFKTQPKAYHWIIAPEGDLAVLPLGGNAGSVELWRRDRQWEIALVAPDRTRTTMPARVDLDVATIVAEGVVVQRKIPSYVTDPRASWRSRPSATGAQLAQMSRWKIPVEPGMTCGRASDLLALASARRPARPWLRRLWGGAR